MHYFNFEGHTSIVLDSPPEGVDDSYRAEAIKMYQEYVFGKTGGNLRDVKVLFNNGMEPGNIVYVEQGGHFSDYASKNSAGGPPQDIVLSILFKANLGEMESFAGKEFNESEYYKAETRINRWPAFAIAEYYGGESDVIGKMNDTDDYEVLLHLYYNGPYGEDTTDFEMIFDFE